MKHSDLSSETPMALPRGFAHGGEHPQLDLPFGILIGNRKLDGISLSVTHAMARGTLPEEMEGTVSPVAFRVNFDGFSVVLFLDAWIERTDDGYTLHYTEPTGPHLAPLRYLLNSYIAGDVVSLNGVMGYTGPVAVKAKAANETTPGLMFQVQNVLRRVAVVALSAGLGLFALNIAHQRVVFAYESRPVTVTAPGQTLLATAAGQLSYVDTDAGEGDVVYSIVANSGDFISVKMPCDCQVLPLRDFVEGATILPGTPLVRLTSGEGGLVANTEISAEGAARLVAGDMAELQLPDGTIVEVAPSILPSRDEAAQTVPIEVVLLETEGVAPGDVARLRFRRHLLPAILRGSPEPSQ